MMCGFYSLVVLGMCDICILFYLDYYILYFVSYIHLIVMFSENPLVDGINKLYCIAL